MAKEILHLMKRRENGKINCQFCDKEIPQCKPITEGHLWVHSLEFYNQEHKHYVRCKEDKQ